MHALVVVAYVPGVAVAVARVRRRAAAVNEIEITQKSVGGFLRVIFSTGADDRWSFRKLFKLHRHFATVTLTHTRTHTHTCVLVVRQPVCARVCRRSGIVVVVVEQPNDRTDVPERRVLLAHVLHCTCAQPASLLQCGTIFFMGSDDAILGASGGVLEDGGGS